MKSPSPLLDGLARIVLSRQDSDRLLAALLDEYHETQVRTLGAGAARTWYRRQVLRSILPLWRSARAGAPPFEGFLRGLRQGARSLARSPLYGVVAVVTLALGVGANTALFSVVQAVLVAPLPYDAPERIVRAWAHADDGGITDFSFRVVELRALEERGQFDAIGGEFPVQVPILITGRDPEQVDVRMVSPGLFRVFGVEPARGRMFTQEEIAGGEGRLAVLSHTFWLSRLGARETAVGGSINLDGELFTVVGVLPEGYEHISGEAQVFVPYTVGTSGWIGRWLDLYVRVRPEGDPADAVAEINAGLSALAESEARTRGWHATVEPLHEMVVGDTRMAILTLFGTATLVFLIACVNLTVLAVARGMARRPEMSVRRAMGAGRARLALRMLAESVWIAGIGGVLGVLAARVGLDALIALGADSVPRLAQTRVGGLGTLFAVTGVAIAGLLIAGVSTSAAVRGIGGPGGARGSSPGRGAARRFGALVTVQVGLAVTLLVGAGLLARAYQNVQGTRLGFDRDGLLTFRTTVSAARTPDADATHAFFGQLREGLSALPGVMAVGSAIDLPLGGQGAVARVNTAERVAAGDAEGVTVLQRRAAPGFFETMGTRVLDGRVFDGREVPGSDPVAVLSAGLAEALFPSGGAVGQQVGWGRSPDDDDWLTVVGVVEDVRYVGIESHQDHQIYEPHAHVASRDMAVLVRTAGDPTDLVPGVRAVLRRLDPTAPVYAIASASALVDRTTATRRLTTDLFLLFGVLALALTAAGLYGVLAYSVHQRRREIGVRIALGAQPRSVLGLVLGRAMKLIAMGLVAGLFGAAVTYRALRGLLFEVSPLDPLVYASVLGLLTLVAAAAAYTPARQATSVDPLGVLREE